MKISIVLITYNQQAYIRQCMESVLMQQSGFETELIIADDSSTDNTLSIIRECAAGSRFKSVILPNEHNLGAAKNYQRAFKACNGNYIAVIEGDDYWTDPKRLEKHVEFLECHRECVMTMNRFIFYHQDMHLFRTMEWKGPETHEYITSQQLARGNKLGNLSACVFRRSELDKIKPDLFDFGVADWMLGMVLGQFGFIAILKEVMSVYRIHQGGLWSKMNSHEKKQRIITGINQYNHYLEYKYDREFNLYKKELMKSPLQEKFSKYKVSDFIPPIVVFVLKLFIPNVVLQVVKKR